MKNSPLISIVIPCYNVEKYIDKTLDSLLNQTINNIELIIVDDGSTDNTLDRINRKFNNKNDLNYTIIKKLNSGVSSARNTGLDRANGKYILFLDSDDFIENNMIELMTNKAEEFNLDIVFCGYDYVDEYGNFYKKYNERFEYINYISNGKEVINKILKNKIHIWTGSIIYKTSFLKENNLRYYEGCNYGEDFEFICKCVYKSKSITSINQILSHYLQRDNSLVHNFNITNFKSLGAMNRLRRYMQNNGANNKIIKMCEDNFNREALVIYNRYLVNGQRNEIMDDIFLRMNFKFRKKLRKYKLVSFNKEQIARYLFVKLYVYNLNVYIKFMKYKHNV